MSPIEVSEVLPENLREPLHLLEEWLREGDPLPDEFVGEIRHRVEAGDIAFLTARLDNHPVGVLLLAFRPNVSLADHFASIEDLYVTPEARRQGAGKALLQAAEQRCKSRGISYLEAQIENDANAFYAASGFEQQPDVEVFSRSLLIEQSS